MSNFNFAQKNARRENRVSSFQFFNTEPTRNPEKGEIGKGFYNPPIMNLAYFPKKSLFFLGKIGFFIGNMLNSL